MSRFDALAVSVGWQRLADGACCSATLGADGSASPGLGEAEEIGLQLIHEGDAWHVIVKPQVSVIIDKLQAVVSLPLADADALYLNGYNSWTDSVERRPDACTPGFGVPRCVIDRWVLDGSGDYRFAKQDGRPGRQHGFEYGYLRWGDEVALFGTLDVDSGFTSIYEDLPASTLTFEKEPPACIIAAGERLEVMGLCLTRGALDVCVDRWLALMGVTARPAPPLVGYSSWYRHYGDISAAKLVHDLDGVVGTLGRIEAPGRERLFQIDDGYAKVGDWLLPDMEKFPHGLAPLAARIRGMGLLPGLWIAPFVCERESRLFSGHPDWLLRDEAGHVVRTGSHWSGQVALDTQNAEVRAYISRVLDTITRKWGFSFLKCDFLYGACMLPHAGYNRGQLMADALELLRASVPEDTLLDFCGVPMGSALGRAEYCRVGCDVGLDWDANWVMRRTGRERVSTKNSLANTRGRAHLDGRAFRSDPDVFFLRDDVRISRRRRAELLAADAELAGMLLTSDDMVLWGGWQRDAFLQALRAPRGDA